VKLTRMTVVDKNEIRTLVEEVREKNYATTVDQLDYGITALAVPIRGASGRTIAALNSSGYSGVLTAEELVAKRLQELRLSAGRISQTLSRYPVLESIIGTR
jgi:IclR family pca regulon transcriptional regulator